MKFYPINPFAGYYLLLRQMKEGRGECTCFTPGLCSPSPERGVEAAQENIKTTETMPNYAIKTKDKWY